MAAETSEETASQRGGRLARSTAFFSIATGLSRVLGLVREVVAASYFGVSGAMSAFTIAFQVPNLIRALFADSALQGAFVPVFTELLEKGKKKEAFHVASSLFFLITLVLGAITALFIIFAEPLMSVFAPGFDDNPALKEQNQAHAQEERWRDGIELAGAWFDGRNDTGAVMWDPVTGGSYDGLLQSGVNRNQGAESALALVSTRQRVSACNRVAT